MKNLIVIFAGALLILAASCTQRTCPTYTKGLKEAPQKQSTEVKIQKNV